MFIFKRVWRVFRGRQRESEDTAEPEFVQLPWSLPAHAGEVNLLIDGIGRGRLRFRSFMPVVEGEEFELDIDADPHGRVRCGGRVVTVTPRRGGWEGEITLTAIRGDDLATLAMVADRASKAS